MRLRLKFHECGDGSRRVESADKADRHSAKAATAYEATCLVCQEGIGFEPFDVLRPRASTVDQYAHRECALHPAEHLRPITDGATM